MKSWIKRDMTKHKQLPALAFVALAMQLKMAPSPCSGPFDMDSELMGIDNRCSACISHQIEDFIDVPQPTQCAITGFMGSKVPNFQQGTILWRWEDDAGRIHEHTIANSFFVPQAGT